MMTVVELRDALWDLTDRHMDDVTAPGAEDMLAAITTGTPVKRITLPLTWTNFGDGDMRLRLGPLDAGTVYCAGDWRIIGQDISNFHRSRHLTREAAMTALESAVTAFLINPDD